MKAFFKEINMKVNKEIKLNNGKIEIITKQEHQFSDLEKEILKVLALNGYYDLEQWEFMEDIDNAELKQEAMYRLLNLGLVEENEDSDDFTIHTVKSEEVDLFFLQILSQMFEWFIFFYKKYFQFLRSVL